MDPGGVLSFSGGQYPLLVEKRGGPPRFLGPQFLKSFSPGVFGHKGSLSEKGPNFWAEKGSPGGKRISFRALSGNFSVALVKFSGY